MAEIILDKINYTYSDGTAYEIQALKDVNLQIHQGEFIGIIGHTGSGKSTLTQLLNGLLRASSGSIYVDGQDIYDEQIFSIKCSAEITWVLLFMNISII